MAFLTPEVVKCRVGKCSTIQYASGNTWNRSHVDGRTDPLLDRRPQSETRIYSTVYRPIYAANVLLAFLTPEVVKCRAGNCSTVQYASGNTSNRSPVDGRTDPLLDRRPQSETRIYYRPICAANVLLTFLTLLNISHQPFRYDWWIGPKCSHDEVFSVRLRLNWVQRNERRIQWRVRIIIYLSETSLGTIKKSLSVTQYHKHLLQIISVTNICCWCVSVVQLKTFNIINNINRKSKAEPFIKKSH